MKTFNKWIRQIHRWLVVPFVSVIVLLLAGTAQQGAGLTGIISSRIVRRFP